MNKKTLLFIMLILGSMATIAQKIEVKSFERLDRDMAARMAKVTDVNGDLCAILKIETIEKGFEFSGCIIEKTEQKTGEIWVYVSPGVKFLTIKHPNFGVLRNYMFPQTIEGGTVYIMKLRTVGANQNVVTDNYLVIRTQLPEAKIYIDDAYVGNMEASSYLPISQEHTYRVEAFNYHTVEGKVMLSEEEKTELNIELKPAFGYLQINTTPNDDVSIEIDNKAYNDPLPFTIQVSSGVHSIQAFRQMYKAVQQQVVVRDGDTAKVNLTLEPNFAEVQLIATDADAELYVDNIYKGKGSWKGQIVTGNHRIEARKNGCRTYGKTLNVEAGKNVEERFPSLEQAFGKLNINTTPIGANIHIDGKKYGTTPNVIQNILVGKHHIRLSKKGYISISDTINIKETGITTYTFELIQGQDKEDDNIINIQIATGQAGDKIYIDGKYIGLSPIEAYPLMVGKHKVEAERNGQKLNKDIDVARNDDNEMKVQIDFPTPVTQDVVDNNSAAPEISEEQLKKPYREIKNRFFFTGEYLYTPIDSPKNTYGFTFGSIKKESLGWYFSVFSNFDHTGISITDKVVGDKIKNYNYTGETAITRLGGTLGMLIGGRTLYFKMGVGYGMRTLLWQRDNMEWVIIDDSSFEGFEANMGFQLMLWRFVISADVIIPINGLDIDAGTIYYEARLGVGFNF